MSRFDPTPDVLYARCVNCGIELPDEAAVREHFRETFSGQRSHQARIMNPTRAERIQLALDELASDALREFVDQAYELMDEGVTEEEITEAARSLAVSDFADAWRER